MTYLPIAFSTLMVEAIQNDLKTQTRREIKPQPSFDNEVGRWYKNAKIHEVGEKEWVLNYMRKHSYYKVGDILWVREEHLLSFTDDKEWLFVEFRDGSKYTFRMKFLSAKLQKRLLKRKTIGKWQRARFLPKELSRIFLEVTNLRVEQLHDISEEDAIAEGIETCEHEGEQLFYIYPPKDKRRCIAFARGLIRVDGTYVSKNSGFFNEAPAKNSFLSLFQSINGGDAWNINPWVWAIEFKRIEKPSNFPA